MKIKTVNGYIPVKLNLAQIFSHSQFLDLQIVGNSHIELGLKSNIIIAINIIT